MNQLTPKLTEIVRLASPSADDRALTNALRAAITMLNEIPSSELNNDKNLGQLIMLPVFRILQRDSLSDTLTELVLQIMTFTFKYPWKKSMEPNVAKQLFDVILYLIGGPQNSPKQPSEHFKSLSDETCHEGTKALVSLFQASIASDQKDAISGSPMSVSYCITVLLNCLERGSTMEALRLAAIEGLNLLCFALVQSGEILSLVLPGLLSTSTKLVAGKYGHVTSKVTAEIFIFVGQLLAVVFNDSELSEKDHKFRTESWLKASKEQVFQSLGSIVKTSYKTTKTVLLDAQFSLYSSILTSCSSSLDNCRPICFNGLLNLCSSDNKSVSSRSQKLLEDLSSNAALKSSMELSLYDKAESLPRLLAKHDSRETLEVLYALSSAIKVSDSQLLIDSIVNNLESSFQVTAREKSISVVNPKEFQTEASVELIANKNRPFLSFESLGLTSGITTDAQVAIGTLLETIGASGNSTSLKLCRRLFDRISEASFVMMVSGRTNAVVPDFWMLLYLTKGIVKSSKTSARTMDNDPNDWLDFEMAEVDGDGYQDDDSTSDLILDVLDFCTETIRGANSAEHYSASNSKTAVPYLALSIEFMAEISQYLGSEFKQTLVDTLFPLVSALSHPNSQVVLSAQFTISVIARSCGYKNVRNLLTENIDYLIDGISSKINTLDITPQTPLLLSTLIRLTGVFIVGQMDDLVSSMFLLLDNYHGYTKLTEGIFNVFQAVILENEHAYKISDQKLIEPPETRLEKMHIKNFEELMQLLNSKPIVDEEVLKEPPPATADEDLKNYDDNGMPIDRNKSEDIEANPADNPEEEENKKWDSIIPKNNYMTLKRILEYANTFLVHDAGILRYNLLSTVCIGIPAMATSKNDFLPLVNTYWPLLISKLEDPEIFVIEAALDCIAQTSKYAREFLTSRIVKLWNSSLLKKMIPSGAPAYSTLPDRSNEARRIAALSSCLAIVIDSTELPDDTFDDILRTMLIYLDDFPVLSESFSNVNDDAVWLEKSKLTH